jgi:hypothetical protein
MGADAKGREVTFTNAANLILPHESDPLAGGIMRIFLLSLLAFALFAADPPDAKVPPLPPEAQRVVDEHDAAAAKAKQAYDVAMAKINADAIKKMESVVVKVTKVGDLKAANATQAVLDGWKSVPSGDLLGDVGAFDQTNKTDVFGTEVVLTIKGTDWIFSKGGVDITRTLAELKAKMLSGGVVGGNIGGEVNAKGWSGKLGKALLGEHSIQGYLVVIYEKGLVYYNGSHPTGDQCAYSLFEKKIKLK